MSAALPKKLLFIVNVDWFFVSHRLPIATAALERGYEVHIATEVTDCKERLEQLGIIIHDVRFGRSNSSLPGVVRLFYDLLRVLRQVRPQIVHLVTIKPVLIGGIATRVVGVPAKVSAISGLGFAFVQRGWVSRVRRIIIGLLYRAALAHPNSCVIFQNESDRDQVLKIARVPASQVRLIHGSGVNLDQFRPSTTAHETPPIVMMAARLLFDKGVREFVRAATLLKNRNLRFALVGGPDPGNPASLTGEDVRALEQEGAVEVWGHRSDMAAVLAQATIVVLPSYYGEGLPKVLLEAAACGKPVITTDEPGCRNAVIPEITGLLVPARDAKALADAIQRLIEDPERISALGSAGRSWVEAEHDIHSVVKKQLGIYAELMRSNEIQAMSKNEG